MNQSTLYVTDMDGTLLNNGSFVSDLSSQIISDLSADGALITVATARTPATVAPLMAECHTRVPYIVMTGAATFSPVDYRFDSPHLIPRSDVEVALALFDAADLHPFIYHLTEDDRLRVYHTEQMTEKEHEFYDGRTGSPLKCFTFDPSERVSDTVTLMFANGPTEAVRALADKLEQTGLFNISCYPDIFTRGISLLEVFSHGVSKAAGIRELAERVGVDRIVVFGDNLNDLPMFEVADLSVAVGNAFPQVKAAADLVIGPNYDDAVAKFIHDDFYNL